MSLALRLVFIGMAALLFWHLNKMVGWEGLWDSTTDGLTSVFIQLTVISVGLAGAAVMAWSLAGWRKLGALVFVGLVLLDMQWAMENSWKLDPTEATEAGAARIEAALDSYHARNGSYPQELARLVPFYLLRLPEPVMDRGEDWCYQSGQGFYRLGYVWKPGYGPQPEMLKVRIAASAGQPPEASWKCDEDLARLKQYWTDYWKNVEIHNRE
jgi:hypothetical protein